MINRPDGLPVDFSKSPQDIADEINRTVEQAAQADPTLDVNKAVHDMVEAANDVDRRRGAGADPHGLLQDLPPAAGENDNAQGRFLVSYYNVLTADLRAILASKIPIVAELHAKPDGTLRFEIYPSQPVVRVDHAAGKVILANPEPSQRPDVAPFVQLPPPALKEDLLDKPDGSEQPSEAAPAPAHLAKVGCCGGLDCCNEEPEAAV
jgi:hypothetical protein